MLIWSWECKPLTGDDASERYKGRVQEWAGKALTSSRSSDAREREGEGRVVGRIALDCQADVTKFWPTQGGAREERLLARRVLCWAEGARPSYCCCAWPLARIFPKKIVEGAAADLPRCCGGRLWANRAPQRHVANSFPKGDRACTSIAVGVHPWRCRDPLLRACSVLPWASLPEERHRRRGE